MPRKNVKENPIKAKTVDLEKILPVILKKVGRIGNVDDLAAWKKAFPEVEFPEIDEGFSGRPIKWDERSATEKAIYVAYMREPQTAKVSYELLLNGLYPIKHEIDDSEMIWWMWMADCFTHFEAGAELSYEARRTLLYYAAQQTGDFQEMIEEMIDSSEVELKSMEMTVKALD